MNIVNTVGNDTVCKLRVHSYTEQALMNVISKNVYTGPTAFSTRANFYTTHVKYCTVVFKISSQTTMFKKTTVESALPRSRGLGTLGAFNNELTLKEEWRRWTTDQASVHKPLDGVRTWL